MDNATGSGAPTAIPAVRHTWRNVATGPDSLAVAVGLLVLTDLAGGLIAIATRLNTWSTAWGSTALLAAPLPMVVAQIVLAVLALRLPGRRAAVPAGLLCVACLVSVTSGFFDGGLTNRMLTAGTRLVQVWLLSVTALVGVLAARQAVQAFRRGSA